ncbi:hypothetical protein LTR10_008753 [Elasticomyces elasticus]|uniref:Ketoreductase (KR) domain-containing protein n=1 Tax=Elasticomyces elasticus TaxID=574655 RepID=A0AAN7ZQ31_9PEZI|nr:hypothetical protein LTR10_008753 [Elasticomyces elasticus]KAK4974272.1 hypothetical protein LTR42_004914 [Elasticomyces elasticus]KAK5705159.1 hypothetical protein LTR97_002276 [Elasticomyces elasticus]KAK5712809.1 hypothetical protein LTR15_011802 [Elasticomyces elasticus]
MASPTQEIVLITGGNTGLGFELAKQLLRDHNNRFYVLIGSRTLSKGETAVQDLHSQGLTACEVLHIEVTDDDSIAQAAKVVGEKFGRVDVLHVNAGIASGDSEMLPAGESLSKSIMHTMATNVAGAAQTAEAFIPLLQKADNPRLIFMSTGLGSLAITKQYQGLNKTWPCYSASKAALNMIMLYFWGIYGNEMRVNACNPGYRGTALNGFGTAAGPNHKPGPIELGARNAVRLTLLGKDGESGLVTGWKDDAEVWEVTPW